MSKDVRHLVGDNVKRWREATMPSAAELKARQRIRNDGSARRQRKTEWLSQAELAARIGVDRAHVSSLETGRRNPTILTLWHVAQALGIDISKFFESTPRSRRW